MKKTIFSFLCVIFAVLLCACGAPAQKIYYIYKFGYVSEEADGLLESYEYTVESEEKVFDEKDIKPPYYLVGTGSYKTNIYAVPEQKNHFKITSEFSFNGHWFFTADNSVSADFTDTITSESFVVIGAETFLPISSVKITNQTLPTFVEGVSTTKKASYTVNTIYTKNAGDYTLASTVTDNPIADVLEADITKMAKPKNAHLSINTKDRFIENEHIFLNIRMQNITTTFKDKFKVLVPLDGFLQTLNFSASTETEIKKFKENDAEKDYDCIKISASLTGDYTGTDTVMYFTNSYYYKYLTDANNPIDNNISLLLEFKQGNLIYKLTDFTNYALKQ